MRVQRNTPPFYCIHCTAYTVRRTAEQAKLLFRDTGVPVIYMRSKNNVQLARCKMLSCRGDNLPRTDSFRRKILRIIK